jgi:hypothetical protein
VLADLLELVSIFTLFGITQILLSQHNQEKTSENIGSLFNAFFAASKIERGQLIFVVLTDGPSPNIPPQSPWGYELSLMLEMGLIVIQNLSPLVIVLHCP